MIDPDNQYDSEAVGVYNFDEKCVGYIPVSYTHLDGRATKNPTRTGTSAAKKGRKLFRGHDFGVRFLRLT